MKEYTHEFPIEIDGAEIDFCATFSFMPGDEGVLHALPENCRPATEAEVEVFKLQIKTDRGAWMDVSSLLDLDNIMSTVCENVWEHVRTGLESQR